MEHKSNHFPEMSSEPTIGPKKPPFFAMLSMKLDEVESRLGTCTEQIEADLSKIRHFEKVPTGFEKVPTGNEIYEPVDLSEMVLLRINCIFDILTRLEHAQGHLKTIV